jgi:hypothetical protein
MMNEAAKRCRWSWKTRASVTIGEGMTDTHCGFEDDIFPAASYVCPVQFLSLSRDVVVFFHARSRGLRGRLIRRF